MKYFTFIILLYLLTACEQSTSIETSEDIFAIYLLKDSTITAKKAFSYSVDSLTLTPSSFLTVNGFKSYAWNSHSFELKGTAWSKFESFLLSKRCTSGVPFVVTVGNNRIYLGTFWWGFSSNLPPACAVINASGPLPHKIYLAGDAVDKRSDSRIYYSLKKSGILVE